MRPSQSRGWKPKDSSRKKNRRNLLFFRDMYNRQPAVFRAPKYHIKVTFFTVFRFPLFVFLLCVGVAAPFSFEKKVSVCQA